MIIFCGIIGDMVDQNIDKNRVHKILAHGYSVYFFSLLFGLSLDFVFKFNVFNNYLIGFVGLLSLLFGTFLIIWAQMTSVNLKIDNLCKDNFCKGPYRYTRSPTHWGLFFLVLGFGLINNSFFVILSTIFSFFITKFIFIRKQEIALTEKYGTPYLEYKRSVNL